VGEQLREARENKGLDLFRVERDTKIRMKYLEALEGGDFSDLPGEVYTRGFLRNYASYLGLDADEIIDDWRRETGERVTAVPQFAGPRPVTIRRGLRFERIHLVALAVVIVVLVVGSYFGFQLTRFLQYPTLGLSNPTGTETVQVSSNTTTYIFEGSATPGTTVLISWDGQEATSVIVDDSGHWTYTAQLHFGSNEFDITAKNLDTNHASKTTRVVVVVPVVSPTPPGPMVAFTTPADGASVASGTVSVTGTSEAVSNISLSAIYLGAPPVAGSTAPPVTPAASSGASPFASTAASLPPGSSPAPSPASVSPLGDGSFSFSLQLSPGSWELILVGSNSKGQSSQTVYRTIAVPYKGLTVTLQVTGGEAWMWYDGDGTAEQSNYPDGWTQTLVLNKWFCVSVPGKPDYVYVTMNGTSLGPVSAYGGTHLYLDTTHAPKNVSICPA